MKWSPENNQMTDVYELDHQLFLIRQSPLVQLLLDATNMIVLILNDHRQIVFASKSFLEMVGVKDPSIVYGQRLGNAVHCIQSENSQSGCGGSLSCKRCSVLRLILESMDSKEPTYGEASIMHNIDGVERSLNILEHVVPMELLGQNLYIVTLVDITDTVHRRWLERLFYHDILNKAGAIAGYLQMMRREAPELLKDDVAFMEGSFREILDDIQYQKWMTEAEGGSLKVEEITFRPCEMLQTVAKLYEQHEVATNKKIVVEVDKCTAVLKSDYLLLRRILGNMVKNALEASHAGDTIHMGCILEEIEGIQSVKLWVQNPLEMSEEVKSKVFIRYWSTKGEGRGIGTYSMKLFGEEILHGKVQFVSDKENGTIFSISLPISGHIH